MPVSYAVNTVPENNLSAIVLMIFLRLLFFSTTRTIGGAILPISMALEERASMATSLKMKISMWSTVG